MEARLSLGGLANAALALAAAPLLLGIINRTKAVVAGRRGPPLLQAYWDLRKLLGKGAVYSRTTSWAFRAGPALQLAGALLALGLVPLGRAGAALSFSGDFLALAGALAAARFGAVLGALDTGSSFEGMGASREAQFSALAEPALLLSLAALARRARSLSLSAMLALPAAGGAAEAPTLGLVALALFLVCLAENARIPVDDPNTHLELTMVHEVMALDHGGPDLAFIEYGAALKLWALGALAVGAAWPGAGRWGAAAGLAGLAAAVGGVESAMARLRLVRVPQLLIGAAALAALALLAAAG